MTVYNSGVVSTVKNYIDTQNAFLPSVAHIALEQESGLSFVPCVKQGDVVQEGQMIAYCMTPSSKAVLHSSVPGTVEEIVPSYFPNGKQGYCVNVKTKGSFSYLGHKIQEKDLSYVVPSSVPSVLAEKGVVNTFRTGKPENLASQIYMKKCRNVVARLFDDENLTDALVSKFYWEQVVKGCEVLAKTLGAENIVFAVDSSFDVKNVSQKMTENNFYFVRMNINKYPSGDRNQIIRAVKKENARKKTSISVSSEDLFIDASTAYDVYKAVLCSVPVISRNVTFSGNCLHSSCMLDVRLGTPIKDVVFQLGGFAKKPAMVIINGKFLGNSLQSLESPITKYTKSVKIVSSASLTDTHVYSCINCGNCRAECPENLLPDLLFVNASSFSNVPDFVSKMASLCTGCSACNCACPSRLPLSQTIEVLKNNLLKNTEGLNEN